MKICLDIFLEYTVKSLPQIDDSKNHIQDFLRVMLSTFFEVFYVRKSEQQMKNHICLGKEDNTLLKLYRLRLYVSHQFVEYT